MNKITKERVNYNFLSLIINSILLLFMLLPKQNLRITTFWIDWNVTSLFNQISDLFGLSRLKYFSPQICFNVVCLKKIILFYSGKLVSTVVIKLTIIILTVRVQLGLYQRCVFLYRHHNPAVQQLCCCCCRCFHSLPTRGALSVCHKKAYIGVEMKKKSTTKYLFTYIFLFYFIVEILLVNSKWILYS